MWNAEKEDYLRANWGPDKKAAELAKELGFPTKNAVIGKARRLGLPKLQPGNRIKWQPGKGVVKKPRSAKPNSAKPKPNSVIAKPPPKPKPAPYVPTPLAHDVARVSLLELETHHCRWPVGEPVKGFCGCQALEGRSYCAGHHERAHERRPAAPRPNYTHPSLRAFG